MKTFSITDVGMVRQVNQDYVYMTDNPLGPLPNLFVVADGMGGHQAGDYASKYTVEVLKRELENTSEQDVERALVSAIKTANREIIKKASEDPHLKGMGTTVVLATIVNQMMYFANVGDSRLYLINQGSYSLQKIILRRWKRWYALAGSSRRKQSIIRIKISYESNRCKRQRRG